ncbi:MFS transporter [Agromyces seonyuensis]|uniref:MFS transporter n=1 Tax=Agromyces seonyuensis TaxID=2662446 RepID=A0A6I4P1W0_9MICO|nr:MFS transporter [Agromyces seonyuensis]MWC00392.1 MFS transporter [Agromyces seonyuensis]
MPTTTGSRAAFIAIAVSVASLALLQNLVIPVIPLIRDDFGASADAVSWTMTAWLIAAAIATPLLGKLGDLRGRRATFLAVLVVVAVGDIVAMAATNLTVLIVGRVLQGIGGALFALAFSLLRDVMPRERLTGSIGAVSAVIGIGGAAGSVLAGPLAEALSWRGIFSVPLVVAGVGILLTLLFVPANGQRAAGRVNLVSAALLSGWLVALLVPLSSGARWGWASPLTIGLFALAAVLLAVWAIVELRSDDPLVDLRLVAGRAVWPINAASLLIGAAAFGFWGYLPQYLETPGSSGWGLGLDIQSAGLALLPLLVGMSGIGFAAGALARVIPLRALLAAGALLMGGSVAFVVLDGRDLVAVALAGGVFGIGIGLAYAAAASLVVESVPADRTGVATGVNANLRTIGSATGSALTSVLVFGSAGADGVPAQSGYQAAWIAVAGFAVLAALIVIAVRPRREAAASAGLADSEAAAAVEPAFDAA